MNSFPIRSIAVLSTLALLLLISSGCGEKTGDSASDKSSDKTSSSASRKAGSVEGIYEDNNVKLVIELAPAGKAILTELEDHTVSHLTWEMDGNDKVAIHGRDGMDLIYTINSQGSLSDGMGGIFKKK